MKIVYLSSKVLTDTRQTREQLSDVLYDVTQIVKKKKKKENEHQREGRIMCSGMWKEAPLARGWGRKRASAGCGGSHGGRWELAGLGHAVEALGSLQVCWVVRLAVGSLPVGALGRGLLPPWAHASLGCVLRTSSVPAWCPLSQELTTWLS